MKKRYLIACASLVLGLPSLVAQTNKNDSTLNRTVVVEREYNPIVEGTTKVNVLPKVVEPNITPKKVEYDLVAVQPKSYAVALVSPMVAIEQEELAKKGYLRFGFGNYGNLDGRAHYTFMISPKDRLTVDFSSYGMNGKLDQYYTDTKSKWNAFYYRTQGSLAYEHKFDAAVMKLFASYKVNNFNYANMQELVNPFVVANFLPNKQRFNSGSFGAGVVSTDEDLFIKYDVTTEFRMYERQHDYIRQNAKESSLNTTAKLRTDLNTSNAVGLDLNMYNRVMSGRDIKSSTTFDMNPYYGISVANWSFRLGAHIDLGFGHGESFLVSPDVRAELNFAESYKFYAQATGGRIKSDFTRMENLSPYSLISTTNRDTYETINASLGIKGSPLTGLWFHAFAGYQRLKDDLFQEIGTAYFPSTIFGNSDTNNGYVGAKVQYKYKKLIDFSISSTYRNWKGNEEEAGAILLKPKFDFEADLSGKIITPLLVGVNYKYVTRNSNRGLDEALHVNNINKLSVYATYQIIKNLTAYGSLDNLLNKKYQYFYGYPVEGTNFIVGLSFKF